MLSDDEEEKAFEDIDLDKIDDDQSLINLRDNLMGNLQEEDEEVSDESRSENVSGGKDEGEIEDDDMYEEIDI